MDQEGGKEREKEKVKKGTERVAWEGWYRG